MRPGASERSLLRCLNVAYRSISPAHHKHRQEVARRMLEVHHDEETGLTREQLEAEILRSPHRYPGSEDMVKGFSEAEVQ